MSDHLASHWPSMIRNLSPRTRRITIGTAAVIPALLIGVLGSTHPGAPRDSGLVACAYPLSTQDVHRRLPDRLVLPAAVRRLRKARTVNGSIWQNCLHTRKGAAPVRDNPSAATW
jgi:hypothetical protein